MTAVGDSVPKPLRFIRFGDIRWNIEKRRHICRRFPPFFLTACVRSLLSVALFGCNFSIVRNLAIIAFTRFIFRNFLIIKLLFMIILNSKRLFLPMYNPPQLAVNCPSDCLILLRIILLNASTEICEQTKDCIGKHGIFNLCHIVQHILCIICAYSLPSFADLLNHSTAFSLSFSSPSAPNR